MQLQLHDWQTRFLEGMRRGGSAEGLLREPAHSPSSEERFDVYRNGYWLRVSESLLEDFPLTERLLGTERFESAMRDFLAADRAYELELGEVSPNFARFFSGQTPSLTRALQLDLLAVEARRAAEPMPFEGGGFGLHPSARFLRSGHRGYIFWRHEGEVLRERITEETERLLRVFAEPASLDKLGLRLEGFDPAFVQEQVTEWSACGLLCAYGSR